MVTKSNELETFVLLSVGALYTEIVKLITLVAFDTKSIWEWYRSKYMGTRYDYEIDV